MKARGVRERMTIWTARLCTPWTRPITPTARCWALLLTRIRQIRAGEGCLALAGDRPRAGNLNGVGKCGTIRKIARIREGGLGG